MTTLLDLGLTTFVCLQVCVPMLAVLSALRGALFTVLFRLEPLLCQGVHVLTTLLDLGVTTFVCLQVGLYVPC